MATTYERVDKRRSGPDRGSEIFDRMPPQNIEAERNVLGCVLLDPRLCDDVALLLRVEDFYADAHQKLYHHLLEMHNANVRIDTLLLVERLKTAGDFDAIGGAPFLAEVAQSVATAANAEYYAKIVREKATLRSLIQVSTEIVRDAYEESDDSRDILGRAEQRIFALGDSRAGGETLTMDDVVREAFDQINARMDHGTLHGVLTGFKDLDHLTGGLQNSELVILAARPSMGKTALATNIAEHVAMSSEKKTTTLFVSLEMARLELANRMLCSQAGVDAHRLRDNIMSDQDRRRLVEAGSRLSEARLFVDDTPTRSMSEIAATARRLKRQEGLGLVVIDYLQLIEPDNTRDPRQEQVARIARRLKGMARELQVPVLCLAQLNRQPDALKGEGHKPQLSHLRESGAIEQDADVVMFVHREEYYHTREDAEERGIVGQADILVRKQRNGPTGDVKLTWEAKYTRFKDRTPDRYAEFDAYDDPFVDSTP